ncbi:MAG TPA: MFS transporter [Roseiflexaceae bacterium]|nr:MFS transporter [Roseiflexaceae bacterium]
MSSQNNPQSAGMKSFTIVWLGQVVSLIGSGLTSFALGVWVYMQTGSTVLFATTVLFARLPIVFISPIAGAIADRYDRRLVMLLSDAGSAVTTLAMVALAFTGNLTIWHIFAARLLYSVCGAFQMPAYYAAIGQLVPQDKLGNANGMVQLSSALAEIIAPLIAGALLVSLQLQGLMLIDLVTFVVALVALLSVRFNPAPAPAQTGEAPPSFLRQITDGWRHAVQHPGIVGLIVFFMMINFTIGFMTTLAVPMVLKFSTPAMLGLFGSISGLGLLVGSIGLSVWGGPKQRIQGVLGGTALIGLFLAIMGLLPNMIVVTLGGFGVLMLVPIVQGCGQTIMQSKVPAELQGRVFGTVQALATVAALAAVALAGPLTDSVFEPLLAAEGALAGSVGQVIGVGPGRGIGFMFILLGALTVLVGLGGYQYARLRNIEREIPDSQASAAPAQELSGPTPVAG